MAVDSAAAARRVVRRRAVGEADWRADLLTPAERIDNGRLHLPQAAGLGAALHWPEVRRRGRVWTP